MMKRMILVCTAASAILALASQATASTVTFGSLPQATFNGTAVSSGQPNSQVEQTTFTSIVGGFTDTFILGFQAQQRFSNAAPSNNGLDTWTAAAGGDSLDPTCGALPGPACASWNFDYFLGVDNKSGTTYTFDIFYDLDPTAGTPQAALGHITFSSNTTSIVSDSQNLGFSFLRTGGVFPGVIVTSPTFPGVFNPSAPGQYSFILSVSTAAAELGRLAGSVNVAEVPEPSTLLMFGAGLVALVVARKRLA
jgi:PEP-CTERM motif